MSNLDKKVERAIKLLQAIPSDDIELAFSGGKDSSVILKLAQMAGIKFTPIYKNTTIDPSGNIQFCKSMGCTITPPPIKLSSSWCKKGVFQQDERDFVARS